MKIKKGSLSDLILLSLEKSVDGYIRIEDFIYKTHIYAAGYDRSLKKAALAEAFKRLRQKRFVEEKLINQTVYYQLSSIGEEFLKFRDFNEADWDGKWRIIIFDIPEKNRQIRNLLRYRLKEWGFIKWQKSVWATKRNITKRMKELIIELKISHWVAFIESDNVWIKT